MGKETARRMSAAEKRVVFASSVGTAFEWYDFYLYGAMATIIAKTFFGGLSTEVAFVFALLALAAGFLVRPLGALLFGWLGDTVGRKSTLMVTLLIMGLSTFMVGVLPSYADIGVAAPVMLIVLRMLQGLALGGEYAGAALFVAEHAPKERRGYYTGWIQATATVGLLLSLAVVIAVRALLGEQAFAEWGWRIPFMASALLLVLSFYMRVRMQETPVFTRMRAAGQRSRAPLREIFTQPRHLKGMLVALLGLTAGQAAVWYASQLYSLIFLTQTLGVDAALANKLLAISLLIVTPFFLVTGAWSDRVGRKPIIMAGCLLAALTYIPAFHVLSWAANPDLMEARRTVPVVLMTDQAQCSVMVNPLTRESEATSGCDIARRLLSLQGVRYSYAPVADGQSSMLVVGAVRIALPQTGGTGASGAKAFDPFKLRAAQALQAAGYPERADPQKINAVMVVAVLAYLGLLVTLVYGPMAAMLVEMFPTRIRYSAVSIPYHFGNGWFGGMLPMVAFAIVAQTGDMFSGLAYPVAIAAMTFVVGMLFVKETRQVDIDRLD